MRLLQRLRVRYFVSMQLDDLFFSLLGHQSGASNQNPTARNKMTVNKLIHHHLTYQHLHIVYSPVVYTTLRTALSYTVHRCGFERIEKGILNWEKKKGKNNLEKKDTGNHEGLR
ncbi:hypothetical protein ACJX0J_032323 [Zea mays]